jgi:uncharacterized protein
VVCGCAHEGGVFGEFEASYEGGLLWKMEIVLIVELVCVGMAAGFLGGLAGVGGSMLILPALGFLFGYPDMKASAHVYMAAAMVVNFVVAIPSARRHYKAGAVRRDLLWRVAGITGVMLVIGVLLSNLFSGVYLVLMLAGFLMSYCVWMGWTLWHKLPEPRAEQERATTLRLGIGSTITGLVSGFLGLGGGVIQVPLLQIVCKIGLRQAIGTSAMVMIFTAFIGASVKLLTLGQHGGKLLGDMRFAGEFGALELALCMSVGAVPGAMLGAKATHSMPLGVVRGCILVLILCAACGLVWRAGRTLAWF